MKRVYADVAVWLAIVSVFAPTGLMPAAHAQLVPPAPAPNDTLISPRFLSENRVLFQIYAPGASEVTIRGDWMEVPGVTQLAKDSLGVWAVVVGPLVPDYYSYAFTVDGVRTLDPKNAAMRPSVRVPGSIFYLPGEETAFMDLRPVPHGEILQIWYPSSTLGVERRMHVYTPPGYHLDNTEYPVFYLLHGAWEDDAGWSTVGRAGFILDNLIADGKAVPMIVVMPNGSLPAPENPPAGGRTSSDWRAFIEAAQARFTSELMNDVIPAVESRFRVRKNSADRAIAGLSMGGGQTLRVLTGHWDQFAYAGIWSAGLLGQDPADFVARNGAFLGDAVRINQHYRLMEIACGELDYLFETSKALAGVFTEAGIAHGHIITGGEHSWVNWRKYLRDMGERLFR